MRRVIVENSNVEEPPPNMKFAIALTSLTDNPSRSGRGAALYEPRSWRIRSPKGTVELPARKPASAKSILSLSAKTSPPNCPDELPVVLNKSAFRAAGVPDCIKKAFTSSPAANPNEKPALPGIPTSTMPVCAA